MQVVREGYLTAVPIGETLPSDYNRLSANFLDVGAIHATKERFECGQKVSHML